MASFELHTDPEARAAHIFELVGITPDARLRNRVHIPLDETVGYIEGVQASDSEAAERLVATRLPWVYSTFAASKAVQDRTDLALEDILQMGCLATIESAMKVDLGKPSPNTRLQLLIPRVLESMVRQSKLLPDISRGKISHNDSHSQSEHIMSEELIDIELPVGDSSAVKTLMALDRTVMPPSADKQSTYRDKIIKEMAEVITEVLNPRAKEILFSRPPLTDEPKILSDIGAGHGVTGERIRQIESHTHAILGLSDGTGQLRSAEIVEQKMGLTADDIRDLLADDANYGLPDEPVSCQRSTPERTYSRWELLRQAEWLEEIAQKQRDGKLTFVRGKLATEPLPETIEWFIVQNPLFYEQPNTRSPAYRLKSKIADYEQTKRPNNLEIITEKNIMDLDMNTLAVAIKTIAEEKNLPEEVVKDVVEQALAAACRRG